MAFLAPHSAYKIHPNRQGAIGDGSFGAVVTQRTKRGENASIEIEVADDPLVNFTLAPGTVLQQVNDQWFDQNTIPEELRLYIEG